MSGINQAHESGPRPSLMLSSSSRSSKTATPLGTGLPTQEELLVHYPAKFTWKQLKMFVNSGDLGLLKRDKKLQIRYAFWAEGIKLKYGSIVNYLKDYRLQWGKHDTLSLIPTALDTGSGRTPPYIGVLGADTTESPPPYFTANTPAQYISVIQNDWPYSVPPEVEHTLIWTNIPVYPIIPPLITARVSQDGLWGFTGLSPSSPPPSPSTLPSCLPALAEWGITLDKMITSARGTAEEEEMIRRAGAEIHEWVRRRWVEGEWEAAWFVNPPRLQSVPGLAHIHVFARRKV